MMANRIQISDVDDEEVKRLIIKASYRIGNRFNKPAIDVLVSGICITNQNTFITSALGGIRPKLPTNSKDLL